MAAVTIVTTGVMRLPFQPAISFTLRRHFARGAILSAGASNVPRVASPSLWQSLVPKAFRQPDDPVSVAERERNRPKKSNEWNPATFFIAMAVLIGSNAIQAIALRNERLRFTRKTEAKLSLLRETIERVRNGEDIDVEKVLGTGDPEKEQEWDEVMKEIEHEDALWQTKKKKREQRAKEQLDQQSSTPTPTKPEPTAIDTASSTESTDSTPRRPGFY